MTTLTQLVDTVQLGVFLDNLLPATLFAPGNEALATVSIPTLQIEDVLKNMIFELLWFDDSLVDLDGETLTSTSGKEWLIQVMDDPGGELLRYVPERTIPVKIVISNTEGLPGLTNCTVRPGFERTNIHRGDSSCGLRFPG